MLTNTFHDPLRANHTLTTVVVGGAWSPTFKTAATKKAYKKIFGITDAPNRPQYTLLCLGHGGSGKSTLLAVLMQEDLEEVESPTKGFASLLFKFFVGT